MTSRPRSPLRITSLPAARCFAIQCSSPAMTQRSASAASSTTSTESNCTVSGARSCGMLTPPTSRSRGSSCSRGAPAPASRATRVARRRHEATPTARGQVGWLVSEVALEPGKDRLEERVLHEPADGLPDARVRVVESAGEARLRRDVLPRRVLEERRDAADHALVELLAEALALVGRPDLQIGEDRLHVAARLPVLHGYL